ncbi:Protein THN-3 [Aphelenchoides avenae]|nr:Protein THN-3 [Aphelenchus avenae]
MASSSALLCLALAVAAAPSFAVKFKLVNNCKFTIWPGLLGPEKSPLPWDGGLKLNAGEIKDINVPAGWRSNRIWARTGCDGSYNCETGFCGPKLNTAAGVPGSAPAATR